MICALLLTWLLGPHLVLHPAHSGTVGREEFVNHCHGKVDKGQCRRRDCSSVSVSLWRVSVDSPHHRDLPGLTDTDVQFQHSLEKHSLGDEPQIVGTARTSVGRARASSGPPPSPPGCTGTAAHPATEGTGLRWCHPADLSHIEQFAAHPSLSVDKHLVGATCARPSWADPPPSWSPSSMHTPFLPHLRPGAGTTGRAQNAATEAVTTFGHTLHRIGITAILGVQF